MVVFGALVFVFGDENDQVIGGVAFIIALANAGMAVGQWPELRAARDGQMESCRADRKASRVSERPPPR